MSSFTSSTNCELDFTEEEIEILTKASILLNDTAKDIWINGNGTDEEDQASFFLSSLGGGIKNMLKGNYYAP